jgi:putative ABC transport system permease protein
MKLTEVIRIAWEAIVKNKVRSFLTMLGIIIGVAAVIIMVAISAGTEATIQEQITSLGSNLLFVQSSFSRAGPPSAGGSRVVFTTHRDAGGARCQGCDRATVLRNDQIQRYDTEDVTIPAAPRTFHLCAIQ